MNTPAHLIFGAAAFGKRNNTKVTLAAFAGAFAPDLSLYLMVAVCIFVLGIEPMVVFEDYYHSDQWQQVFAIDNSFVFWGIGLGVAIWRKSAAATAFALAGLLHLALDFPVHNDDARMHFWPISDWKFISPVSYWDPAFAFWNCRAGRGRPLSHIRGLSMACAQFEMDQRVRCCFAGFRAVVVWGLAFGLLIQLNAIQTETAPRQLGAVFNFYDFYQFRRLRPA